MPKTHLIPIERVERTILLLRGQKVILDAELAALYAVETRELVQAVKRNPTRFPTDFVFRLSAEEVETLRSQSVISKPRGRGGRRTAPLAFTEEGVAMLSSVLRTARAVHVNVAIMRAFVRLRRFLATDPHRVARLNALERKYAAHDRQIIALFDAIRELMAPPAKARKRIGFGE